MSLLALLLFLFQSPGLPVPQLGAPVRIAAPNTPAETTAIRAGVALHDQQNYDAAIARYEEVLKANPDNVSAMYELAYTHSVKREFQNAIDIASKGTEYQSPVLPQFWGLIGNTFDGLGEPQKAIEIYKKGISIVPNAGTLYFNMGVTYSTGMKDPVNAVAAFKQGAMADPNHAGVNFQLGTIFLSNDLKTPALLAISRFLILEPATARSATFYNVWRRLLNGNAVPASPGGPINIGINPAQKKDEGDVTILDLDISMSKAVSLKQPPGRSEIQSLVDQVDMLLKVQATRLPGEDKGTFLWRYYMPYFSEMQQKNFVEPFVYYVNQRSQLPGVSDWLTANRDRVNAFLDWSRNYRWPRE